MKAYIGRVLSTIFVLAIVLSAAAGHVSRGDVDRLWFEDGSKERILWSAVGGAEFYALYRGHIRAGRPFAYDHRCLATAIPGTLGVDRDVPVPGEGFYYLVAEAIRDASSGRIRFGGLGSPERGSGTWVGCGARYFVDADATGAGDGTSWEDAYTSVDAALQDHADEWNFTLWIRGNVPDQDTIRPWSNVRFRGGFSGTETVPWDRDEAAGPSRWSAPIDFFGVESWTEFDRIHFVGVGMQWETSCGDRHLLWVHDSVLEHSSVGMYPWYDCGGPYRIELERCTCEAGSAWIQTEGNMCQLVVRDSRFTDGGGLRMRCSTGQIDSECLVEVERNEFIRTGTAIEIFPTIWYDYSSLRYEGTIADNVIADAEGDAIFLGYKKQAQVSPHSQECRLDIDIVHNTIVGSEGDGIRCELGDYSEFSEESVYSCEPRVWNNIFAANRGYAFREGWHAPGSRTYGDPEFVGNDVFENGHAYLDEGATVLESVDEINALEKAWGNVDLAPRFANQLVDDYHLGPSSPLIDAGQMGFPGYCPADIDGQPRIMDGDGDGVDRPDIGADEVP